MFNTSTHINPRINPLAQIAGILLLLVPVFLSFDPWTPILVFVPGLLTVLSWVRPDLRSWSRFALPFLLLSGSLFVANLFFTRPRAGDVLYWTWGPLSISSFSVYRASSILSRTLVLTTMSTLTIIASGPMALIRAMIQNLKLSPRWGFSLYAGFNILPCLVQDLNSIRQTRKIRYGGRKASIKENMTIPVLMLSSAVRRGERISLSMAARGLENPEVSKRTYLVKSPWKTKDTLFVVNSLFVSISCYVLSHWLGFFRLDLG